MDRLFNIEGPVFKTLTRIADILILNFLFVVCSIPVFTIGASITGLYYVTLKMVKDEECYMAKDFFKAFKTNFKQATVLWLITLVVVGFLVADYFIVIKGAYGPVFSNSTMMTVLICLLLIVVIACVYTYMFMFPLVTRYENTVANTIKNAFIVAATNIPTTIAMIVITAFPVVLMYYIPRLIFLLIFLFSGVTYVNSFLVVRVFDKITKPAEITPDEEFSIGDEE